MNRFLRPDDRWAPPISRPRGEKPPMPDVSTMHSYTYPGTAPTYTDRYTIYAETEEKLIEKMREPRREPKPTGTILPSSPNIFGGSE